MIELYKYILENTSQNKIDKDVAINIVKKLKEEERKGGSKEDIAITGVSLEFPKANDIETWWNVLKEGVDCIGEFPKNREADLKEYFNNEKTNFYSGAYLKEIDNFDYSFFGISPREASLMDPYQRIFLQKAWQVIEDAGYNPKDLWGSRTGLYVGYSSDFGEGYKRVVEKLEPKVGSLSTAGNIHSIIASRIAYILNLKGPSMMVDTACSSSLVAVHLACKAMQNKECSMAIAGGIKINIAPIYKVESERNGIESSTERTRTFDDSSDGTGLGEGCALIFLKPLKMAIEDNDNIYAVIKGSAINQDGNSIGITAPNAEAQEDVIVRAWKDAEINPETIDYIEAHGTGTNLGDPIEIEGITRAFKRYTDKKQFCGIGSVKTNIGHLDNASGIASLIKVVIALNKCKIPPTINFSIPNRNIDFKDSPVYINDILREWEESYHPRRCGISAFGLSGTNCHMVLEEGPKNRKDEIRKESRNLFKVSAKSYEALNEILIKYKVFLSKNREVKPEELCFTANTKRGDYNIRLAIIIDSIEDLITKINKILSVGIKNVKVAGVYIGEWDDSNIKDESNDNKRTLESIAISYVNGQNFNWSKLYNNKYMPVKIPTYQFKKSRCWVGKEDITHPFLKGTYIDNGDKEIYLTMFSSKEQWVVEEHKIYDKNVPPGTTYVEMACEIGRRYFQDDLFNIKDITFLFPMIFEKNQLRKVRTTVKKFENYLTFQIESQGEEETSWIIHANGTVEKLLEFRACINIEELKKQYIEEKEYNHQINEDGYITLSNRWNNVKRIYKKENSILGQLTLPENYYEEDKDYNMHPALLDMAVNLVIRNLGDELYLPFSYKNLKIYGKMPNEFYCLLNDTDKIKKNMEAVSYKATMMDEYGNVFAEIENYSIKRVNQSEKLFSNIYSHMNKEKFIYQLKWSSREDVKQSKNNKKSCVLIFNNYSERIRELYNCLHESNCEVIKVKVEGSFKRISDKEYLVGNSEEDFLKLFKEIEVERKYNTIINAINFKATLKIKDVQVLKNEIDKGIVGLFNITKALINNGGTSVKELIVLSQNGYRVTGNENSIEPLMSSVLGFAKVINQEYSNIRVKGIDTVEEDKIQYIVDEIINLGKEKLVAIRNGQCFVEELTSVKSDSALRSELRIDNEGAYIITGGTGGIGIELAKHISFKNKANICLISKSGVISKEKMKIINLIEESGSKVEIYKCDVCSEKEVEKVLSEIRSKFKNINGIFHGAGIPGEGFILGKKKQELLRVIDPKVIGTWLLDKYTQNDNLDFFVLFSSITSKVGGRGQSDYAAANSYLDAYGCYMREKGKNSIVINWAPWKETGMAFDYNALKYEGVLKPLTTTDAVSALDKVIIENYEDAIVGEINNKFLLNNKNELPFKLDKFLENELQKERIIYSNSISEEVENKKGFKVNLVGKDNEYTENERLISHIIGNVIGMRKINVEESFKDMGIDSIIASIIVKDIDEKLPNVVSIADFYTYSTIMQLGEYIDRKEQSKNYISIKPVETKNELEIMLNEVKTNKVSKDQILEFLDKLGGSNNE